MQRRYVTLHPVRPDESRNIRIDGDVYSRLRDLAEPGETANTVLRRVLGLPARQQGRRSPVLKPYEDDS